MFNIQININEGNMLKLKQCWIKWHAEFDMFNVEIHFNDGNMLN